VLALLGILEYVSYARRISSTECRLHETDSRRQPMVHSNWQVSRCSQTRGCSRSVAWETHMGVSNELRKLVLVLVVASMSVLAKCGHSGAGSPSGAAVPQQSSPAVSTTTTTASTSQTTSTSPSQSTPVPASWPTYTSASGGYTIRYPDTWHHLPNLGQPPEQEYFSNEQVASPEQMSPAGVWVTVTASAGSCAPGTPRAWAQKGQQTVHTRFGDVVLVYGDSTATQAEAGSIARTAVSHPRGCATFEFVSKNRFSSGLCG